MKNPTRPGSMLFTPDDTPQITAPLRIVSQTIKPFDYPKQAGEVVEIKAIGTWGEHEWPISLHITVPPGCSVIPATGDEIEVTITRTY